MLATVRSSAAKMLATLAKNQLGSSLDWKAALKLVSWSKDSSVPRVQSPAKESVMLTGEAAAPAASLPDEALVLGESALVTGSVCWVVASAAESSAALANTVFFSTRPMTTARAITSTTATAARGMRAC